jgi:nitroimidazol reductase NimA-like FMN-containing flavoprotein (pyridoxamine 5'-phosphate oxidase superfamily)
MTQDLLNFSQQFIKDRFMAVVACVSNGEPRSFTCWYCVSDGNLYWKSRTQSIHSKAFADNPNASLCIYDHAASYPDNKTGVQVIGTVRQVKSKEEMQNVLESFASRFGEEVLKKNNIDELCAPETTSTFYAFTPQSLKLVSKDLGVHMEEYESFSL